MLVHVSEHEGSLIKSMATVPVDAEPCCCFTVDVNTIFNANDSKHDKTRRHKAKELGIVATLKY